MSCSFRSATPSSSCQEDACVLEKMVLPSKNTHMTFRLCLEIAGLKRKLRNNLSPPNEALGPVWEVGECVGIYWRPNFETILYPYLPPHITRPKECKKLFIAPLPEKCFFSVRYRWIWRSKECGNRCRRICVYWRFLCLSYMITSNAMDLLFLPSLKCSRGFVWPLQATEKTFLIPYQTECSQRPKRSTNRAKPKYRQITR